MKRLSIPQVISPLLLLLFGSLAIGDAYTSDTAVTQFLHYNGFGDLESLFAENDVTFDLLQHITEYDLEAIGVRSWGIRKKISLAIDDLSPRRRALADAKPSQSKLDAAKPGASHAERVGVHIQKDNAVISMGENEDVSLFRSGSKTATFEGSLRMKNGVLQFGESAVACNPAAVGSVKFSKATKTLLLCNGDAWRPLGGGSGSGSGGGGNGNSGGSGNGNSKPKYEKFLNAYAQLEARGKTQVMAANKWTSIAWDFNTDVSNDVNVKGSNIMFAKKGVYQISLAYRPGNGGDVWTSARLAESGSKSLGHAVNHGNPANDPACITLVWLATVTDTTKTHQIQIGRLGSALTVNHSPGTIAGEMLPAFQASVEAVHKNYIQLEGPAFTTKPNWNTIGWTSSPARDGITASGKSIKFTTPGVYQVTLSYRPGTGGDVWTGVRLAQGKNILGVSNGYGQGGANDVAVATTLFLARVWDVTQPAEIQLGRLSKGQGVAKSSPIAGEKLPEFQSTIHRVRGPYADLAAAGFKFAKNTWTAINFNYAGGAALIAKGVRVSGTWISFDAPGVYQISVAYRPGVGGDVWTGCRVTRGNGFGVGHSVGHGQNANDPAQMTQVFHATIEDTSASYQIQMGRLTSEMAVTNPSTIAGQQMPAIQCTVGFVSSISSEKTTVAKKLNYLQLEARGSQSMAANKWTSINWNYRVPLAQGASSSGKNIKFSRAGVYQISIAYRPGGGGDVWTSARVFDGQKSVGHAVGHGHPANDPALITLSWLFKVDDPSKNYQLQIGRLSSALNVAAHPNTIEGQTLPNFQSSIEEVTGNYIQLEGAAYRINKNCEAVKFQSAPVKKGISFSSSNIMFSSPGVYQVTLSYRPGTGNDVWTGVRMTQGGKSLGHSNGYGQGGSNDPAIATVLFLVKITDTKTPCQIQLCRLNSYQSVANPGKIGGETLPGFQATIHEMQAPFAQLESKAQVFPADGDGTWTGISYDAATPMPLGKGIEISGSKIYFKARGVYQVSVSFRPGTAKDVWTSARLAKGCCTSVGHGVGHGNSNNDPAQMTNVWTAIVDDIRSPYYVQIGRTSSGSMSVTNPSAISGEYFPALQVTVGIISPLPKPTPIVVSKANFGQLEARGSQVVKANTWQSIQWNFATPLLDGVKLVDARKIRFSTAGVYQVSIAYRPGGGSDVWTSARVLDGAKSVGHAVGHGHPSGDPACVTLVWLFNVADTSKNYEIQIGRLTSALSVHSSPSSIEGEILPNYQSTLELVQGNYIQLEGKAYTSGKNCQPVQFQSVPVSKGISLPKSGADIKFSSPGVYQVTLSYRPGTGGDCWTGVRLVQGGMSRGHSNGYGQGGSNDPAVATVMFLVHITDISAPAQLHLCRLNCVQGVATPASLHGEKVPAFQATIHQVASSYAQLEAPGQSFPADTDGTWTGVNWNAAPLSKNIRPSGRDIYFSKKGIYQVSVGYRPGSAKDVWSSARLSKGCCSSVGHAVGHGNSVNDPAQMSHVWTVVVDNIRVPYQLQLGRRDSGTLGITNPGKISGESFPAIQSTITLIKGLPALAIQKQVPYAQLETRGTQIMTKNAWTSLSWKKEIAVGVSTKDKNIKFSKVGVYQISIAYRPGGGRDVWTSARCFDGTKSVGHAAGHGHPQNDPAAITLVWLCNVGDVSRSYQLQIGRDSDSLNVHASPSTIEGYTLPNYQATIEFVGDNYVQLEGKALNTKSKAWTPIPFQSTPVSKNFKLSNTDITFGNPGIYQVTLSYRPGQGGDVWTGVRLTQGGTSRGHSNGYGQGGSNDVAVATTLFLVPIYDTSTPCKIELGRISGGQQVVQPSSMGGEKPPAFQATITQVSSPYAQLEALGQSFPADSDGTWTGVMWNYNQPGASPLADGITANGKNIMFEKSGAYQITVSYRPGTANDVWTANRLTMGCCDSVGHSVGHGNSKNDPAQVTQVFVAIVKNIFAPYQLQFGRRDNGGMSITNPAVLLGEPLPAIQTTITFLHD